MKEVGCSGLDVGKTHESIGNYFFKINLPLVMLHTIALLLPILAPKLGFLRVMMKFFGP